MSATGAPAPRPFSASDGQADQRRKRKGNGQNRNLNGQQSRPRSSSGNNVPKSLDSGSHGSNSKPRNTSHKLGDGKGKRKPREDSKLKNEILKDEIEGSEPTMVPTRRQPKLRGDPIQSFTSAELKHTGNVFQNPEKLGFLRNRSNAPKRNVPRYMLTQPRLLATPPFQQNAWDAENQSKMLQIEASNNGSDYQGIYETFQKMRDVERKKMEELGLVDAENITKDLNDAILFHGSCLDMCPTFERVRRALENNVMSLEKDPATNKISRERAIKAFSRPAAGQPPPMPSDVRPPHILIKTLDYLVDNILPRLPEAHSFIWDRTRSIRQDFIYQNFYGPEAIDCNERIVRIHLLSLHIMSGSDVEYSQQQELEQFNKALQTLTEIYQDVRNHGGSCPNEAEFRAYHLISHFRDPELERDLQTLPDEIAKHPYVQLALRFRFLMSQNNIVERGFTNSIGAMNLFVEFFRLVYSDQTPILIACLLETHFNEIRFYALKSLSRSYHTKGKALQATMLQEMLGFDNTEQLIAYVSYYEVDTMTENGSVLVDLFNKEKLESKYKLNLLQDKPKLSQAFSLRLDSKLKQTPLTAIINSGRSNSNLGMREYSTNFAIQKVQQKFPAPKNGFIASETSQAPAQSQNPSFGFQNRPFGQPTPSQNIQPSGFGRIGNAAVQPPSSGTEKLSFNILDFLSSQNGGKGEAQPQPFGAPKSVEPISTPSFSFGKQPEDQSHKKKSVHFAPQLVQVELVIPKPTLGQIEGTSREPPKTAFNFGAAETPQVAKLPLFEFKPKAEDIVKKQEFSIPQAEIKPTILQPSKALLKQNPRFEGAAGAVVDSILSEVIDFELRKLLPRIVKHENKKNERKEIVNALTVELFLAFVSELSYGRLQVAYADNVYHKKLLKKKMEIWKTNQKKKRTNNELRLRKLAELNSVNFKVPSLKRRHLSVSQNESFSKRRVISTSQNTSFDNIQEKQNDIQRLWMPLDLEGFVESCSRHVRASIDPEKTELKFLLIVEDWTAPYSKWLNTKFGLKPSAEKTHYENRVGSEKMAISFESLPKSDELQEGLFTKSAFVLFECGILNDSQASAYKTLAAKLARDSAILKKIVQICDRYCLYQVHILVTIWDTQGTNLEPKEAASILNIDELEKSSNSVKGISTSYMSAQSMSVIDALDSGLRQMGESFSGDLTARGLKRKLKLQKQLEEKLREQEIHTLKTEQHKEAEEVLKLKEEEILRKAKDLLKYNYLSKHLVSRASAGVDLTNTTASFRTPNATFANNTLVNFNNSFLANNTTVHPRNGSFLGSFCNASILEESTPFASPKPSRPASRFAKPSAPKKVQELRDLTAAIRARYKK